MTQPRLFLDWEADLPTRQCMTCRDRHAKRIAAHATTESKLVVSAPTLHCVSRNDGYNVAIRAVENAPLRHRLQLLQASYRPPRHLISRRMGVLPHLPQRRRAELQLLHNMRKASDVPYLDALRPSTPSGKSSASPSCLLSIAQHVLT